MNLDPLSYPDDPSVLILNCRKLEELKLEWSPRMRNEKEPSVSLHTYFGKALAAKVKLPVKRFALKNMFARNDNELVRIIDQNTIESATLINCIDPDDAGTVFNDETWILHSRVNFDFPNLKRFRMNLLDQHGISALAEFGGFTEIYLVNRKPHAKAASLQSPSNEDSTAPKDGPNLDRRSEPVSERTRAMEMSPPKSWPSPGSTVSPGKDSPSNHIANASIYLAAITSRHGLSLKKLLLSDRWCLS
jgi:hypothetical protein